MAARKKAGRPGTRKSASKRTAAPEQGAEAAASAPVRPAGKAARKRKGARKGVAAGAAGGKDKAATARAGRGAPAGKARAAARKALGAQAPAASSSFPEIEELAGLMDRFDLLEVRYCSDASGATEIHVSRRGQGAPAILAAPAPVVHAASSAPSSVAAAAPAAPAAGSAVDENLVAFKSPMVGTFYRAPSPEASPFCSVGDKVDSSSVVCIIEAMKVMNEIRPDVAGEVVSIEVENGEAVEFGQTLMLLRPR